MARTPKYPRPWWLTPAVVVTSVGLAAFSLYLLVLDHEVRTRFAGARWALPAQVYASPLELYPGLALTPAGLKRELERAGYRAGKQLEGPGTYSMAHDRVALDTRQFTFWDGPQPESRLLVRFNGAAVTDILDLDSNQPKTLARLDPLLIGSIYPSQGEDRALVKLDEVPPLLPAGLIYVEDRNFEHHRGIAPKAILRALFANLRAGHVVQGGSTITQQLVKNFFLNNERTLGRKINEAFMALLLEAHYEKPEILEAYLNEVFLGQDGSRSVHGFGLASQFYFNKPLAELQPQEIALLVGLVKGPSYYNPRKRPERAKERRNLVLSMFAEAGYLTPEAAEAAARKPLGLAGGSLDGGAERYPAFVELVKRQLRGQYQEADLTNEGLRIFTTLNPRMQEILENRIAADLPRLEKGHKIKSGTLEAAGVIASVEGGEVLALTGGRDARYAGFNRALDAQRPIGSLAKPFVYLTALMHPGRYNLQTILDDEPIEVPLPHRDPWAPKNYDEQSHGKVPFYVALAQSYNLATVRLGMNLGVGTVRDTFKAAGIAGDVAPLPSLFLGAVDLSPLEVTQMYATLAADGYQTPLLAIREVTTKEGQPLARYPLSVRQALPEGPVYLLNWALEQVMIFGTAQSAYNYVPPSVRLAGKTGTTDDLRDSWFAGFDANRVAVIWVGRDDNKPAGLTGAGGALQIWAPLMRDLDARSLEPVMPADVEEVVTDPETGLRADNACLSALALPYMRGYAPEDYAPCGAHRALDWLKKIFQ